MLEKLRIENAKNTLNSYKLLSPFNKEILAEIEIASEQAIETAFENATNSFQNVMIYMPAFQRVAILNSVANLLNEKIDDFSKTIALEGGKPLKDAIIETNRAVNSIRMCAIELLNLEGEQVRMDKAKGTENCTAYTFYEPLGIVLAISAFNHPLNLICHQVATAFAAGNSILVKPASQTPLSCLKLVDLFYQAGCPKKVISVLTISGSQTSKIVSDKRLAFVSFIGSAKVGWEISRRVYNGVKVALEHGGTASAVVEHTCNLIETVNQLVKGSFYHSGQVCISTQIIYIEKEIYFEFLNLFIEKIKLLKYGNPSSLEVDLGPIINEVELNRILDLIEDAKIKGAQIEIGGNCKEEVFIEPTILTNVNKTMKVLNEEMFGPVVCILPYTEISKVIKEINEREFAFQVSLFSNNIKSIFNFIKSVTSKAVVINDATTFRVDWMPFGGYKDSGFGVGGIKHSIKEMSNEKLVVIRH